MKDRFLLEEITAFADNEIQNEIRIKELQKLLKSNENLQDEFNLQIGIKSLLKERFAGSPAPAHLSASILKKTTRKKKFFFFNFTAEKRKIFTPQFAFTILFIIIAVYFLFPPASPVDTSLLLAEQKGSSNMYIQAIKNFSELLSGNLDLDCKSADPEYVAEYLQNNGVAYSSIIPTCDHWRLQGCVVTDNSDVKFAHQVYSGKSSEIIYLFQVDISYLTDRKGIELSDELLKYLNRGNVLRCDENPDYCVFLWKTNDNVFALISNSPSDSIENTFLGLFN